MTFNQINYFLTIAKHLNFTQAASELFVAQSTLSRSMAALEAEIGAKLLRRDFHNVTLTAAGELMNSHTAYVNRLTSLLDQAFPGYAQIFNRISCRSSRGVLKAYSSPDAVLAAEPKQIAQIISKSSRRGGHTTYVTSNVEQLIQTASAAKQINLKRDVYSNLIVIVAKC